MKPGRLPLSLRALAHLLLLRPFLWLVFGVNIRGRENLEDSERYVRAEGEILIGLVTRVHGHDDQRGADLEDPEKSLVPSMRARGQPQ